jgi:hypothetical protein
MAWLRSEQSLLHHPKTKLLQSYLKTTLPETIGRLHMLWYWCLDYALDGDLSRKEPQMIEQSCGIPLKLLIKAGFVDSRPYMRIHDWYDNQSYYLKSRFKDRPDKLDQIKRLYDRDETPVLHRSNTMSNTTCNPTINKQTKSERVSESERTNESKASASRPAPLAGASAPLKSFEEAGENDLCAPPKDLLSRIKK